jgi:hypothetical protein
MPDTTYRFPFATTLDLSPLVEFWRDGAADPKSRWHALAKNVLERVEGVPELNGAVDGPERLETHQGDVERLMSAFMSPSNDQLVAAAMVPWSMTPVYMTETARGAELVTRMQGHFRRTYDPEEMSAGMVMKAYGFILQEIYGVKLAFELPFSWISFRDVESTVPVHCPESGITRRFSIDFDTRFVRVEVVGERPRLTEEEIESFAGDPSSLPRLLELLPPERFAFRGVTVLFAEDVTAEAALTAIRDELLLKDALLSFDGVVHLQEHVRAFMGQADLELGLIGIDSGDDVEAMIRGRAIGRSLLLAAGPAPACPHSAESLYARALDSHEPVFVHDLDCCDTKTGFEHHIRSLGMKSLMIQPLRVDDTLVGLLELGSPTVGALSRVNVFKLEKVQGLFALGLRRSMEEKEDRIQAIIKRDYTAIHPVVEWRFREAAQNRLQQELRGDVEGAEEIVFRDLIPLYGLSDIRGSSSLRNRAVVADLLEQLELANAVIKSAQSAGPQPALGELEYRITRSVESLHPEMATEDESSVLDHLQRKVEPLFEHLAALDPTVREAVEAYRAALDPDLGIVYRKRKDFEESVGLVNETVARVLHDQEAHAQSLVPHFFELFKTDGVDHNIYVGSSLLESGRVDPLDLPNLRLWQLMTMCRIDWALRERSDEMSVPLEATHLILVQNTPLAIRFRRDEKRFDVDGTYNIRYEIVKKRIDKANVRGTGERLTQPGTIAIAYSQEREAAEYRRYLDYLRSAGFIEGEIETLELEDLQGVFGLHAMRVRVRQPETEADTPDIPRAIEAAAEQLAIESA